MAHFGGKRLGRFREEASGQLPFVHVPRPDLRDEAQAEWHKEREHTMMLKDMLHSMQALFALQIQRQGAAHQEYREAKELWRVGRDFNVTDPEQARLLQKLRDGGRQ